MVEETLPTVWNFDGAELNLIFQVKTQVTAYLMVWNLESAYWSLRDLRRELDAKFNRSKLTKVITYDKENKKQEEELTEKGMVDNLLGQVEDERTKFLQSKQEEEDLSRFYIVLEGYYMHLSRLMKEHGLYFREGDDPSKAFQRR